MDDLNYRMMEAKRAQARALQARLEADRGGNEPVAGAPTGHGELQAWSRGDQHTATLLDHVVRPGDELDLYVGGAIGWLRGRFVWDGDRPALTFAVHHPERVQPTGEARVLVPERATCRWARPPGG
ncbi:MAG: hypothetical protein H6738_21655 [Alphaproteobacteria bacterium]|nr:hypothetical protein [Alphaproteobacteria bacterium]MCB9699403.1 hypothetical protein [Alphaproteobacteria bacterium]